MCTSRPGVAGLTPERLQQLYVQQRLSYRAIARELGCSDSAVANAVRYGLVRPPPPPKALEAAVVNEMVRLYTQQRLDLRAVAARVGVGMNRVAPALRNAGVRLRKRGSRPGEHLNPEQLRTDYEAGASIRSLAQREATDDSAIRAALLTAGTRLRPAGGFRKWERVLTREFLHREYLTNARTVQQVAVLVGCHHDTVRKALQQHGIPIRGRRG